MKFNTLADLRVCHTVCSECITVVISPFSAAFPSERHHHSDPVRGVDSQLIKLANHDRTLAHRPPPDTGSLQEVRQPRITEAAVRLLQLHQGRGDGVTAAAAAAAAMGI